MPDAVIDDLEKLAKLHEQGHLSDAEFQRLKAVAIDRAGPRLGSIAGAPHTGAVIRRPAAPVAAGGIVLLLAGIGLYRILASSGVETRHVDAEQATEPPESAASDFRPLVSSSIPVDDAPVGWRQTQGDQGGSVFRFDSSQHVPPGDSFLGWGCSTAGGMFFLGRTHRRDGLRPMTEVTFLFDDNSERVVAAAQPLDDGLLAVSMTSALTKRFQGAYFVHVFFEDSGGTTQVRSFDLEGSRRLSDRLASVCLSAAR